MAYIYDATTGRITAVVRQGTPTPPGGFLLSADDIENVDILRKKRNIGTGLLENLDVLAISGSAAIVTGTVGQIAFQKLDGTTGAPKDDSSDDEAVTYHVDGTDAFLNKTEGALVSGADAIKIAAPDEVLDLRMLVKAEGLPLLDAKVSVT